MSGPRDPLPLEADMYNAAVAAKSSKLLLGLFDTYPNVMWGSVSGKLSEGDRTWVRGVLAQKRSEPQSTEPQD